MAWNPFKKKAASDITQERAMHVPDKVFVEKDGSNWEYSELQPIALKGFQDLLHGYYAASNYISLFHCLPEIFAPIHEIASRVASCNWQLKKDWNDEIDYKDKEFNRLFTTPNPLLSFKDFVYQAVCYELLTGKQLFFFNRPSTLSEDYGNIITWSNLPPETRITENKNVDVYTATELRDMIIDYRIPSKDGRAERVFPTNQVLPLLNTDLSKPYDLNCTVSALAGAEKPIKNLIPVYEARGTIYIKRGVMGFMVSKKTDDSGTIALTKDEKDEANRDVNGRFGLTGNKATISVTAQPIDFVKTSMSISEMEPFDETLADAVAIYAVLRVPRHLVPSKDASTFDNAAADMKSFYGNVIIPMAQRYAMSWTNYMKIPRRYIHADFSHVAELQDNRKEKADVEKIMGSVWEQRILNGISSLNDWVVSIDGNKVISDIYEKKSGEMTPEQLDSLKNILNLKRNGTTSQDTGAEKGGGTDNVQQ